ncbi:MAG: glycosyltransferase [Candidatus Saccharibacteria bacterium]|nr:glycosyltransferase [Candidatus Saccharibacteria bacterium]
MNKSSNPTISVIVAAHREGLLLHKMLLSIADSLANLDSKVTYELIISLDNPDKCTEDVAKDWHYRFGYKILKVSFGNPADNRNNALSEASGKYVSVLDGDDVISENWFSECYKLARKQKDDSFVIRPNLHLHFGYNEPNLIAWFMRDSSDKSSDAIQMAYWNLWTLSLFAPRKTLLKVPFKNPAPGFGHEDYLLCTELIASGIRNIIAPETTVFYRRRYNSVSQHHVDTLLAYSPLFDINFMKSIPLTTTPPAQSSARARIGNVIKRGYRLAYDTAKKIRPINNFISPIARDILYKKRVGKQVPKWVIESMRKVNRIENQIYPTRGAIAQMAFHPLSLDPYENSLGRAYHQLCHMMSSDHLDYLFLAPSMSGRGGTEKLIANYIKALKKNHPTWKIGILSTQPFNDLTLEYFSKLDVDMLDFGSLLAGVGSYERDIIWSRLLVQSGVKRLHLVNDEYWYRWITRHKSLIKENGYLVNISLFMKEFTHEKDRILTFADPHLTEVWDVVNKVFTDNQNVIDEALKNNAFDRRRFIAHYQPEELDDIEKPKPIDESKPLRILWASRIAHQKRPDILKAISKKLKRDEYIVDAYGIIEKSQYSRSYFDDSPINYRGGFNGIKSINTSNYDVYLYTSQTDGIPNILLEISKTGLPIIASDVGGISELVINEKTGILVDMDDINGYVSALKSIKENPKKAQKMAEKSQKLLQEQHSWQKFTKLVAKDIN